MLYSVNFRRADCLVSALKLINWLNANNIDWKFKKTSDYFDSIEILTDDEEIHLFIKLQFSCSD